MKAVKRDSLLTCGILVLLFGFYFLWAVTQPYNSAPDEYMRYQICLLSTSDAADD